MYSCSSSLEPRPWIEFRVVLGFCIFPVRLGEDGGDGPSLSPFLLSATPAVIMPFWVSKGVAFDAKGAPFGLGGQGGGGGKKRVSGASVKSF